MKYEALQYFYLQLAYPVIRALLEETLVLGMLAFAFGQVRHGMVKSKMIRQGDFWRRILLVFGVLVYVSIIILSYDVHLIEAAPPGASEVKTSSSFVSFTLILLPIDLVSALVVASLFGVMAMEDIRPGENFSEPRDLKDELKLLFFLTGVLHGLYVLWWLVVSIYAGTTFAVTAGGFDRQPTELPLIWNGGFHLLFCAIDLIAFFLWRRLSSGESYSRHSAWYDGVGVIVYVLVILCVYALRLGHFLSTYPFQI